MILLMVVLAVGMTAGIVNAQMMSQDFGVANFAADTNFYSTTVAITHTGTGFTDLGFEASGYTTTNEPPGTFGVYGNRFEIKHFSSFSGRVLPVAADSTWGVNFDDNPRTGYIRFDSVALIKGSSLSMSIGEFVGGSNTGDDDVVIRVYLNGDAGLGTDIFDTRPGVNGTLDSSDAVGGATYTGTTLSYNFADPDTSVILYVAILTDDSGEDGYYIDEVEIGNLNAATLVSPINWAYVNLDLLQWLRPDPINEGDPGTVLVNVLFGTEPNLIAGVNGTVQIETNYDGDSTGNFPGHDLNLDTAYYWRVDCIDPNNGNPTVPNTGYTWSFTTTVPEEVTVTESEGSTEVSEQDPIVNRDSFTLSLPKDPGSFVVEVTITEPDIPRSDTFEEMDSFSDVAPKLTVVYDGATVFETSIAVQNDDAEQDLFQDGRMDRGSSDLEFFNDGTSEQIVGLRFTGVTIPQGATIESARVDFRVDSTSPSGQVHGIVTGEDVNNAVGIGSSAYALTNRFAANPTSATSSFMWTEDYAVGNIVPTEDISEVIQEIVNRTLWTSGNSILLFFTEDTSLFYPYDLEFIDSTTLAVLGQGSQTYTLNTGNWDGVSAPVTVTIAAVDDSDLETDPDLITLTFATSSADAAWAGLTIADLIVSVLENECGAWPLSVYDFDLNCVIDLSDFAMFAAEWLACTMPNDTLGICVDSR